MGTEELCFSIDIMLAEKEAQHKVPQVTMYELIESGVPCDGLLDNLRHLVKTGQYKGSKTVNGIPILSRKGTR